MLKEQILNDDLSGELPEEQEPKMCSCGECQECIEEKGKCDCGDCDMCIKESGLEDVLEDSYDDLEPEDLI